MAELMNSSCPLEVSSRPRSAASLSNKPASPGLAERACETDAAAHAPAQANPDDSAQFREEIRRRYEAPLLLSPRHDGLNE